MILTFSMNKQKNWIVSGSLAAIFATTVHHGTSWH